jgi:hypothetical protein
LNTALLGRLNAEIAAATREGRETGGLLLGSFPRAAAATIRVDDFVAISRREGDEERYNLTPEQSARLSTTRHQLIQERNPVVGFFRSHLREEGLALSLADTKFLTTEFGKAMYAALLIRARRPHSAVFVIPDADGVLPSGTPRMEFQFDIEEMKTSGPQRVSPLLGEDVIKGSTDSVEESKRGKDASSNAGKAAFLTAWASLVVLLSLAFTVWAPSTATWLGYRESGLQLTVTQHDGMLEVEWNRKQVDISRASGAVLSIEDDGSSQTMELTKFELQMGKVTIQPRSNRVTFRLALELPEAAELVQSTVWNGHR